MQRKLKIPDASLGATGARGETSYPGCCSTGDSDAHKTYHNAYLYDIRTVSYHTYVLEV